MVNHNEFEAAFQDNLTPPYSAVLYTVGGRYYAEDEQGHYLYYPGTTLKPILDAIFTYLAGKGGGKLLIKEGAYTTTAPNALDGTYDNITVEGENKAAVSITLSGAGTLLDLVGTSGNRINNFKIKNITLIGANDSGTAQKAIEATYCLGFIMEQVDVHFFHGDTYAVVFTNCSQVGGIYKCHIWSNAAGVNFTSSTTTCNIEDTYFFTTDADPDNLILIDGSSVQIVVARNVFEGGTARVQISTNGITFVDNKYEANAAETETDLTIANGITGCVVMGNTFTGLVTYTVADSNIIRNNRGHITENMGTGSIANGATTAVITHALSYTPLLAEITVTLGENPTNTPGAIWVDTITSTQFTVNCENDPGASNLDFSWAVRKV